MCGKSVRLLRYWRSLVVVLTPLLCLLLFLKSTSKELRCAYVIMVMVIYWVTEALPIPVTALMPVFAFPLLGVLSSSEVTLSYMTETNMMFLGGLMIAIAVEYSNLHRRIALAVILTIGQSPRRLLAGFMITTMFLSMWISNTASTAIMVPIIDAILQALFQTGMDEQLPIHDCSPPSRDSGRASPEYHQEIPEANQHKENILESSSKIENAKSQVIRDENPSIVTVSSREYCNDLKKMYFLSTAYAASIGGTGSLTGTSPNLVAKGVLDSSFSKHDLNFASWLAFNVPGMLLCTFFGWIWLQILYMGVGKWNRVPKFSSSNEKVVKQIIRKKYQDLGNMTSHEKIVLTFFIILVLLWFFREPGFIPGWESLLKNAFGKSLEVGDSVPAILIALILFAIPYDLTLCNCKTKEGPSKGCLTWQILHEKIPWGIVLLLGGGFAMAKAATSSGLSSSLGKQLTGLQAIPSAASVFVVTAMAAVVTEVASNTTIASVLMPILRDLTVSICVNPLFFMLPAAVTCSYAFMLPIATPPNAIVYEAGNIKTTEMMKAGFVMKIICVAVINLTINTLGVLVFDINQVPSWMNSTKGGFNSTC